MSDPSNEKLDVQFSSQAVGGQTHVPGKYPSQPAPADCYQASSGHTQASSSQRPAQPPGGYAQQGAIHQHHTQAGYHQSQTPIGYPPPQGPAGYPPPQGPGGYPPTQGPGGYPPTQGPGDYPPPQGPGGYPPPQRPGGYPPTQGPGYPPHPGGYAPPQAVSGCPPIQPQQGYQHMSAPGQVAADSGATSDNGEDGVNVNENLPSAPEEGDHFKPQDTSGLKSFDGYGDVSFQTGGYLPPPPPPPTETGPAPEMNFETGADISSDEAREALLQFVAENRCYGKGAARNMTLIDIRPSNAFHIVLETFCEGRISGRVEIPYHAGERVDGPHNGPPPLPWDIGCSPTAQFTDQIVKLVVPHTDEIRVCSLCHGGRFVRCNRCHGWGRVRCSSCSGRGHRTRMADGRSHRETCHWCHGSGRRTCSTCHGDGRVICPHCKSAGQVKNYVELTVTYKNYVTDYIMEETDMPDELVRSVEGVQVFQQTLPQVWPIVGFPAKQVDDNSLRLVEQAKKEHPAERQLNQRQTLRAVPVSEIDYKLKDFTSRFWVYGMQRKVYSPDYPQQCCWGCNLL